MRISQRFVESFIVGVLCTLVGLFVGASCARAEEACIQVGHECLDTSPDIMTETKSLNEYIPIDDAGSYSELLMTYTSDPQPPDLLRWSGDLTNLDNLTSWDRTVYVPQLYFPADDGWKVREVSLSWDEDIGAYRMQIDEKDWEPEVWINHKGWTSYIPRQKPAPPEPAPIEEREPPKPEGWL